MHIAPAQLRDVDRPCEPVGEAELDRGADLTGPPLDRSVQLLKDSAAPIRSVGHRPQRQRGEPLAPTHSRPVERRTEHAGDLAVGLSEKEHARLDRVSVEPPFELARIGLVATDAVEQPQRLALALRVVLEHLDVGHLLDVPSAALKSRRACVPATVSLTPMRSQAPETTSSNVRAGYGSTL